ncbi:MAG: hypothetical protein PHI23_01645 [Candidatus Peribacteraceae bacterium]|nr:hypothetical protein [Candidatus Peribacteraceae bacterium]
MYHVLGIIGIIGSITILKYRERVSEMIGESSWMLSIGGVYNFIIILATLLFFFSVAMLTGTTGYFLTPLKYLLPGLKESDPNLMP